MMKKRIVILAVVFICHIFAALAIAGDLDSFLKSINVQAQVDMGGFKAKVSAQFGVPIAQVDTVLATVATPADAYMVFRVGQLAQQPTTVVIREYESGKGKGWGVIAKRLGIKPGSRQFHALKEGYESGSPASSGKGKGKGRH